MGQYLSSASNCSTSEESDLRKFAADGDLDRVQQMIGQYIAASSSSYLSSSTHEVVDQNLRDFVNRKDKDGNTAVMYAIVSGHLEIVKFITQSCGGDISIQNRQQFSPIWLAAGYGHVSILKYLICQLSESQDQDGKIESNSATLWNQLMMTNNTGDTPFTAAVSRNHYDVCVELLKRAKEQDMGSNDRRQMSAVKELLWHKNKSGDSPLSVAVSCGHGGRLLDLLLDTEECIDIHHDEIRPLNTRNSKGLTPFLVACERNFDFIVKKLIEKGSSFVNDERDGRSPLALASFCGCKDVVELLLSNESGIKLLNKQDQHGCTPVWLAARTGNKAIFKILVSAGADTKIRNRAGLDVYDVATKYKKDIM